MYKTWPVLPTEIQELIPNKRAALRVFAYCLLSYDCIDGRNNTIMISRLEKQQERSEFPYCPLFVIIMYNNYFDITTYITPLPSI